MGPHVTDRNHHRVATPVDDALTIASVEAHQFRWSTPAGLALLVGLSIEIYLSTVDKLCQVFRLVLLDFRIIGVSQSVLDDGLQDTVFAVHPHTDSHFNSIGA
jgi:hypothetical protein